MATARRLTIFRVLLTVCFIVTLLLPGLLLSRNDISSKSSRAYSALRIHGISQDHVDELTRQRILRLKDTILKKKSPGMVNPALGIFLLDPNWTGDNVMGHVPQSKNTNTSSYKRNDSTSIDLPRQFIRTNDLSQVNTTRKTYDQLRFIAVDEVPQRIPKQIQTFNQSLNKTVTQQAFLHSSTGRSITFNDTVTSHGNGLACQEVHKVAFVKTHKTGGTTVMNIIQRFGHVRDLVFALPRAGNYLGFGQTIYPRSVLPPPKGKKYDMLINHVMYKRLAFQRIMPKESVYITIIRHPFEQVVSAIEYLKERVGYLKKLSRENPVGEYLQNPGQHEPSDYKWSFTNNRMSFDLGLDRRSFHKDSRISQFIKDLDQDFKLVMITEYMDESLLLLKRYLCWSLKDILYVSRNVNSRKMKYNFTSAEIERHKKWAEADYKLYNFFLTRFWNQVTAEGGEFNKELRQFKTVLSRVKSHCIWVNKTGSSKTITIEKSDFNPSFVLQKIDCQYMMMEEVPFLMSTQKKHLQTLKHVGIDVAFRRPLRRAGAGYRPRIVGRPNTRLTISRGRKPVLLRRTR